MLPDKLKFSSVSWVSYTDTQDGKDGGEKEAETYENVFEYLTKGRYPADKSVLRRMSKFQVVDGIGTAEADKLQAILSWKVVGFSFSVVDFMHQLVKEAFMF